jgi:hypothetical protein
MRTVRGMFRKKKEIGRLDMDYEEDIERLFSVRN